FCHLAALRVFWLVSLLASDLWRWLFRWFFSDLLCRRALLFSLKAGRVFLGSGDDSRLRFFALPYNGPFWRRFRVRLGARRRHRGFGGSRLCFLPRNRFKQPTRVAQHGSNPTQSSDIPAKATPASMSRNPNFNSSILS